jgi:Transposase, Mutator family
VVDTNDQAHMDRFLQALKNRGLKAEVVITDGSPLYKDSLQRYWAEVEHQLCIFHVIKEVNKLILDGVRAIKNGCVPPFTRGVLRHEIGLALGRALRPLVQDYP